jgi:hypothetical protein
MRCSRRAPARNPFLFTDGQFPINSFRALTERGAELHFKKTIMGSSNEAKHAVRSSEDAPKFFAPLTVCAPVKPQIQRIPHSAF